jgi:hypothetical protein
VAAPALSTASDGAKPLGGLDVVASNADGSAVRVQR